MMLLPKYLLHRTKNTCSFQADVDCNGTLDYGEFVAVAVHIRKMTNDEHLHKAFTFFDQNRSGYIEVEELRDALQDEEEPANEDVINAILHDVDTDKVSVTYSTHTHTASIRKGRNST